MIWQHTVPKPCTAEDLDKIQTWLDSKEVLTKEEVMLETFGYTDENSVNQAVSFQGPAYIGCRFALRAICVAHQSRLVVLSRMSVTDYYPGLCVCI